MAIWLSVPSNKTMIFFSHSWILTYAWPLVSLSCIEDLVLSRGYIGLMQGVMLPQSEKNSEEEENSTKSSPVT